MRSTDLLLDGAKIDFLIPDGSVITQYPYRTKRVHDVFMEVNRDAMSKLEEKLAEVSGKRPDNHVVYEITTPGGSHLYLMFTDLELRIGLKIEGRRW